MDWFGKAAGKGDLDAVVAVAWLYENGLGVPENKTRALELYRQAARGGHGNARQALDRLGRIN